MATNNHKAEITKYILELEFKVLLFQVQLSTKKIYFGHPAFAWI